MTPAGLRSIGEVATQTGVAASALRYYEDVGLLAPASREGGRRWYGPDALRRLGAIRLCQRAGFSLDEVRALLDGGRDWQRLARSRLDELDTRIAELEHARDLVRAALACDCETLEGCEAFRDESAAELGTHSKRQRGRG